MAYFEIFFSMKHLAEKGMLPKSLVILNKALIDWWLSVEVFSNFLGNKLVSASFIKFGSKLSLQLEREETLN